MKVNVGTLRPTVARDVTARRAEMTRNHKFRRLSLRGGLGALALLGSTMAWSRSTSHPVSPERQGASASESQSSAPTGYVVRTVEESATGTISGRILYNGKPVVLKRYTVTSDTAVCEATIHIYHVSSE